MMTRGTDVTDLFETQHLFIEKAEALLPKFYVRDINTKRNSPNTFEEGGLFKVLRNRVRKVLTKEEDRRPTVESNRFIDAYFAIFLVLSVVAVRLGSPPLEISMQSTAFATVAGVALGLLAMFAHNYIHQPDNFRMYYMDLTWGMSSYSWRISHVLSHHNFANTILDLEFSQAEPFFMLLMHLEKNFANRYLSWLYFLPLSAISEGLLAFYRIITMVLDHDPVRLEYAVPFVQVALIWALTGSAWLALKFFLIIQMAASLTLIVVSLPSSHHLPEIWHEGDECAYESRDFAVLQINSVRERTYFERGLKESLFKRAIASPFFAHHALHHMFPTIDHSQLDRIVPLFEKTLGDFGLVYPYMTAPQMYLGMFRQFARIEKHKFPKKIPDKKLKE